jgi:Xaa-Pro aminopeptidase
MSRITGYDHARRLDALRTALDAHGLAGAVLSRPEHVFYFSGTMPGPSPVFLIVLPQRLAAVAPSWLRLGDWETLTYTDYDIQNGWDVSQGAASALKRALAGGDRRTASVRAGQAVGLELSHLPAVFLAAVREATGEPQDIADLLWQLRRIKDADEIAQIAANVAGNDQVFAALQEALQPGMAEIDLWAVAYRALCDVAGGPVVLEADMGAGPRASNPDARPTCERLVPGDAVLVDLYSATRGYYADTTRVFVLGQPDGKQRHVHGILASALAAGQALLRPGVLACEVDAAVRGVIERAGYGPRFPHHSGHAYGLFQQERPYLIPAERTPLEAGMVVTLEPGIYLPGWGGMRLEGNYAIIETGARRLDRFPSELIVC